MRQRSATALAAAVCVLASWAAAAAPPPEGQCPPLVGPDAGVEYDGAPPSLREGMVIGLDQLLFLKRLLPVEVWSHREAFFFEGMRMEVGPCYRQYPVPVYHTAATVQHWEDVRVDEDGNLEGYVAGVPFPPETIDPKAPDAAVRWVWDYEMRYRGAGPAGEFRLVDMPSRIGTVQTYEGRFFQLQTGHRSDLAASGYSIPESENTVWVAGGKFTEPFNARELAWRQLRPESTERRWREADRTYVYVPDMRKPRRAATTWIDGLFTPRYSVQGQFLAGGGMPYYQGNQPMAINPTSAVSAAASEDIRKGFVGLAIRPNAYEWELEGERDVIAPLNGVRPGWPDDPTRNYGPSGLSVASDRWEVRRAVVVHGVSRMRGEEPGSVTLYIDYQTQQPLYYITRKRNGLLFDVGILVHRWSGDLPTYPLRPDGSAELVFDPVAAVFYTAVEGGTGWRRESYGVTSMPQSDSERRRMTSVAELEHGH